MEPFDIQFPVVVMAAEAAGDTFVNIENVIGTFFDDEIIADEKINDLDGGDSDDTIDGGAGDDVIYGGKGKDTLTGGAGDDTIYAGNNYDIVNAGTGNDVVYGDNGRDIVDLGDGADSISDFEDGLDLIDVSATGLTFGDLTIANDGAGGATVDYGTGDQITLTNTAGQIDQTDFVFAVA